MDTCSLSLNSRQSGFFCTTKLKALATPKFQNDTDTDILVSGSITSQEECVLASTDNRGIKINFLSLSSGSAVPNYSKMTDDNTIKKDIWDMLFSDEPMIVPNHSAIKEYKGFLGQFLPENVEIDIDKEIKRQKQHKRK